MPAHTTPAVVVGTPTAHPIDLVQVLLAARRVSTVGDPRAARRRDVGDPTQWFRAQLPALEPDRESEYRVEWLRAGQRIATLPADGSWYRLRGVGDSSPAVMPSQSKWPSQPRFGYDLDFFAAVTANLSAQPIGPTPEGYRVNFAITDGRMVGPGIDAVVEPNSGDWMCVRPDGIGVVDIKLTLRNRMGRSSSSRQAVCSTPVPTATRKWPQAH